MQQREDDYPVDLRMKSFNRFAQGAEEGDLFDAAQQVAREATSEFDGKTTGLVRRLERDLSQE